MVTLNMLTVSRESRTEPYTETHALQSNNRLYLRRSKTGQKACFLRLAVIMYLSSMLTSHIS